MIIYSQVVTFMYYILMFELCRAEDRQLNKNKIGYPWQAW